MANKLCGVRELAREKMWSRIHLIPMLQAEEDRDQVRRYWADQAREKQLLGENLKVYHSDRWAAKNITVNWECLLTCLVRFVRPTFAVTPGKAIK